MIDGPAKRGELPDPPQELASALRESKRYCEAVLSKVTDRPLAAVSVMYPLLDGSGARQIDITAVLRPGQWPARLEKFRLKRIGLLTPPESSTPSFPHLWIPDLGLLVQVWWTVAAESVRAYAELRWHPEDGEQPAATKWLPESTPTDRRRAETALQLVQEMRGQSLKEGRPVGLTKWLPTVFNPLFEQTRHALLDELGHRPRTEDVRAAMELERGEKLTSSTFDDRWRMANPGRRWDQLDW